MVTRAGLAATVVVAAALAAAGPARADDPPRVQEMKFTERGKALLVTGSVTSVFDPGAYERLGNGLESTVVIRLWVYPKGKTVPVAFQLLHRQVVYDLWDEVYEVALSSPSGRRTVKVKYRAEALKLMTSLDAVPIADVSMIAYDTHYVVAVVAELNPVSQETLAEVRRWLSEGSGGGLDRGGSFFGSFVSVFVNLKIPDADRVVRLRSQPFYRPRPTEPPPKPRKP
ncbi:MAG TPA: hypothetical protein VM734_11980 [Kofleriaceae bacterium]|jgi:hypothetical protein|nr:hypothetical protein [Kofleriaceae bacterium]